MSEPSCGGTGPERLLKLKLKQARFGKEVKSKLLRLPPIRALGRFISVILPAILQEIPNHLHGLFDASCYDWRKV